MAINRMVVQSGNNMNILELRRKIPNDFFMTMELTSLLSDYRNPVAKISLMLKHKEIVPLRRGLYVFAEPLRHAPLPNALLANQIYGPSYVSEDFALSYYGLIPETPSVVTSICMGRSREFTNSFGMFSYRYCRSLAYSVGVSIAGDEKRRFLIALPYKALFDKALYDARWNGEDPEDYLEEDLRMDLDELRRYDKSQLDELKPFMTGRLKRLHHYLEEL